MVIDCPHRHHHRVMQDIEAPPLIELLLVPRIVMARAVAIRNQAVNPNQAVKVEEVEVQVMAYV